MTVFLIVGLPGAGKTTRARELEVSESALRLTPDEWFTAVFDEDGPADWRRADRVRQRDRIEGRLVDLGFRAAALGIDVVFDFGLWGRDERSALRAIAASVGARAEVIYLPVDAETQRHRVTHRSANEHRQFEMTDADLRQWRAQFDEPDPGELAGETIPGVTAGYPTWRHWAAERWPSLPVDFVVCDRDPSPTDRSVM